MKYLFTIFWLALAASAGAVQPIVETDTTYYIVDGETAQEIRQDMNQQRPGKWDAYTEWHVKWRFFWDETEEECAINRVKIQVGIEFTLPKLAQPSRANADAKRRWRRYYKALVAHENGHRDFGINAATEIGEALLAMDSEPTCEELTRAGNALGHRILARYIADEKQYDIETNHGMNEGAVFP